MMKISNLFRRIQRATLITIACILLLAIFFIICTTFYFSKTVFYINSEKYQLINEQYKQMTYRSNLDSVIEVKFTDEDRQVIINNSVYSIHQDGVNKYKVIFPNIILNKVVNLMIYSGTLPHFY